MYGERILNRLDDRSALQDESNPFRKVFIDSIGALLDEFDLVGSREAPYLQEASGAYLDLHGKDLGVKRRLDESDEHYRNRLVYETLGYLTVAYLMNVYDLTLYSYVENFSFDLNIMTSDNPYIEGQRMSVTSDESVKQILGKKFIIGDGLVWLTGSEFTDYIIANGNNVISQYLDIYTKTDVRVYFMDKTSITEVSLSLPSATTCFGMFHGCTGLTSIDLSLPSATNCFDMFHGCTGLTDVTLNLPKLVYYNDMFYNCSALESINVTIPNGLVSGFKSYVLGLELENLSSFIVNGEEVEL